METTAQPVRMTVGERETYTQGQGFFERGETDRALEAFARLLETRSSFADVHYMVGVLFDRKGDSDAAARSLREAIRLNPSYAEALLALASVYERRGDFDRSRDLAERASRLGQGQSGTIDPTTRGKLANQQAELADAFAAAGELREAIENYRKALDRCPTFHDIRYRLGTVLRESGLPHKAELEFRRVLRGNPGMIDAKVQLGLTYYSLGRAKDALEAWGTVLAEDPTRSDAKMYVRLVKKGRKPI